jgi:hypothetical protein
MKKLGKKTWMLLAGVVAALSIVAVAAASVTFDPTCSLTPSGNGTGTGVCGFVGKGDVQTALGYNNPQMQANADDLAFSYSQPGTQALSQDATQSATQTVTETLSCGSNSSNTRTGYRDGSRTGSRSGTRTGTESGLLSYSIDYTSRNHNQVDGFFLDALNGDPTFEPSADPVWGDWSWGAVSWGAVSWGDWSDNSLNACGSGLPVISDDFDYADPAYGDPVLGSVVYGDFAPSGSATLSVDGVALN